jgi:hypothetical protein
MVRFKNWLLFQAGTNGFAALIGCMSWPWFLFWLIWGTFTVCTKPHCGTTGSTRY